MEPGSPTEWIAIIEAFLKDHVRRAGAKGVVVGISGGLDSAVAAALACRVFGPDGVTGILMPSGDSDPQDERDGRLVCDHLGITPVLAPIQPIVDGVEATYPLASPEIRGNAKARARMLVLYAAAQEQGRLVCGTGNKSELLIGYFTKHGDGGNDMQPIGDLYKTQVQELARALSLPAALVAKPPSAGLWHGQTDEAEFGMPYAELDAILKGIELNASAAQIAERTGLPVSQVEKVEGMVRRSEHKRRASLVPKIGARTVGIDWRRSVHWDA